MRQHLQGMFSVLHKLEKPNEKLTLSIKKFAEQLLMPALDNLNKKSTNLNDFSAAVTNRRDQCAITPVNITLITETLRFMAASKTELDEHLTSTLKLILEIVLPSMWLHAEVKEAETRSPYVLTGF